MRHRTARVGVIGLGYAGLPLAVGFARKGFAVTGIDRSSEHVGLLGDGKSYLDDVPNAAVAALRDRLQVTTDPAAVASLDVVLICVPTPLAHGGGADLLFKRRCSMRSGRTCERGSWSCCSRRLRREQPRR